MRELDIMINMEKLKCGTTNCENEIDGKIWTESEGRPRFEPSTICQECRDKLEAGQSAQEIE